MNTPMTTPMNTRILIVEDDPSNAFILETHCRRGGHEVHWAITGSEALEVLANEEFALVLLDVGLPGEDGRAVARMLRQAPVTASLPIVIVTAIATHEAIAEIRDLGVDEILIKPFTGPALRAILERLLK